MRSIFILIPSLSPAGPVKGAIALANGMAGIRDVTLVSVKPGPGANAWVDPRVKQLSLAQVPRRWLSKLRAYQGLLSAAGGRNHVASISMCFSADLLNRFCRAQAFTCASVRGNLQENYWFDYGVSGAALAFLHMQILRNFDRVIALSLAMASQLARHLGRVPEVIGNFVDEDSLESHRQAQSSGSGLRLVFLGNLVRRKQPHLAVQALSVLGPHVRLDVIGDGPLRGELEQMVRRLGLGEQIAFHGYLADPLPWVAKANVFVLPSLSEGIARAALEALHLGLPCVLRDVDGNRELIRPGHNGALFAKNEELPEAVRAASAIAITPLDGVRESLLPDAFRQEYAVDKYLHLIESR